MKRMRLVSLVLVGLVAFQAAGWADTIEGRVAQVYHDSLEVTVYDPNGRPYPNRLAVNVDEYTRLAGISSLRQLDSGDPISVDVRQEESGAWHAQKITLFQEIDARPATKNPPPTMRNVLGSPVVKGALIGAATGAIASGSSGGKAGKGALIGAGVGALGGLLFGGSGDQESSQDSSDYR